MTTCQQQFWYWVGRLSWVQAAGLVPLGVMCMLYGWKAFKGVVLVLCAIGGAVGGGYLGQMHGYGVAGAIAGALLAVLIAWPLMRYVIGILGGVAGAAAGLMLWGYYNLDPEYVWVGPVAGFLVCGALAFVVLRFSVMLLSSLQGAACAIVGIVSLVLGHPQTAEHAQGLIAGCRWMLPAAMVACVCFGFFFQVGQSRHEAAVKTE